MTTVIAAGVLNQPFGSFPVFLHTDDGIEWSQPISIFETGSTPTSIASNGVDVAISNQIGQLAVSPDLENFTTITVDAGFGITSVGYQNGDWIAVGSKIYPEAYGPYPSRSEIAHIYRASSAVGDWSMVWSHPDENSRLYQLKWFQNAPVSETLTFNAWITVGSVNDRGDIWYSLDDGATWKQVEVPIGVGRILSVSLVEVAGVIFWYWGCNGQIFRSPTLDGNHWSEVSVDTTDSFTDMVFFDENLVLAGQNQIYISQDGNYFKNWSNPGYQFDRIQTLSSENNTTWIAFGRSILTQHTHWYSTNLTSWTPSNNGVTVSASTSISS